MIQVGILLERMNIDVDNLINVLRYDPTQPLMFNTGLFMLLFAVFMLVFWMVKGVRVLKMALVMLFSLYFYYKSSGMCCLILLGVCLSDYVLGLLMEQADNRGMQSVKRLIVGINLTINVGMLAYFKYFNLIIDTLSNFFTVGGSFESLLLPAGISFFTFRSISYIVDLYRGEMKTCRNLFDYIFFLTFFPPLLAGPVVRAKDFLPQVKGNSVITREMTSEGVWLIMVGLIKKVVIADFISGNFVDRVFDNPALYSGFENFMATVGFTIQLYCDFSGYSDMAIGIALLMGYRFRENFNAPFKSQSPTEFWRRWHISLSSWLRDYVYIPLGGNHCSRTRMYFNQFATMLIGGLWHGASWMYVIWGAIHGVLLVFHKMIRNMSIIKFFNRKGQLGIIFLFKPIIRMFNMLLTFMLIAVAFMFFRAPSLDYVVMMWHQIFNDFHLSVAPQFIEGYLSIVVLMLIGYVIHVMPSRFTKRIQSAFEGCPILAQAIILAIVVLVVIQVRQSDIVPFIYLQY